LFIGTATITVAANATSYLNTGLTAGTRYYYRVRAVSGSSVGSWSSSDSATA
jgi:hypothetical protein